MYIPYKYKLMIKLYVFLYYIVYVGAMPFIILLHKHFYTPVLHTVCVLQLSVRHSLAFQAKVLQPFQGWNIYSGNW